MTQSLRNVAYLHKFTFFFKKKESFILFFRFSHSLDTSQYVFLHTKERPKAAVLAKKVKYAHTYCIIRKMKYEMEYKIVELKKKGRRIPLLCNIVHILMNPDCEK
jgi:hypothetical protein